MKLLRIGVEYTVEYEDDEGRIKMTVVHSPERLLEIIQGIVGMSPKLVEGKLNFEEEEIDPRSDEIFQKWMRMIDEKKASKFKREGMENGGQLGGKN